MRCGKPGNHISYGVREFGMSATMNGVALHGGYMPFGATFLTFSDYSRNALRMAALMKLRVDLRVHPRLHRPGRRRPDPPVGRARFDPAPDSEPATGRPCDTVESMVALGAAVEHHGPSTLIFTRQNLPYQERTDAQIADIASGGYVLATGRRVAARKSS